MQDNWQEFDRHFKSVMQDAEEKAPRRVWRAVSSRLDSVAAAAAWWRWAVPAFAAAALVAGLFFSGIFDRNVEAPGDIQILADSGQQSGVSVDALAEVVPELSESPSEAAPAPAARRVRRASAPSQPSDVIEDVAESPESTDAREIAPSDGKIVSTDVKDEKEAEDIAAQWARIASEDQQKRTSGLRIGSLYAQGGVGGNDSNISYGGNGISRMAPGAGSADAGISEASASTYGVPFTIGLGVSFPITEKLSIGTGLDYSLLSRSFTGGYNNGAESYNGSIFHDVSYVGIPVNAYYKLISTRDGLMDIYAWGGGSAEVCVANNYRLMSTPSKVISDKAGAFQFSTALGVGIQFKVSDKMGIYLDPAVRYYFHGNQPKSVRTDKPFMFNFDAGLRFNL
ncbi:MAG: PorT family protein [Bacteroidales bacterium]|nr:PorT family protein [Bacteroidales bacterium]